MVGGDVLPCGARVQALARCNATGLDSVRLVNVLHVCGAACLDKYAALPSPGGQVRAARLCVACWLWLSTASAHIGLHRSEQRG